jgi:hypothetical protein
MDYRMYLLWIIEVALQVGCAVHALKTGRAYYWLFIILFFPMAGSLIYFAIEVLPELRHHSTIQQGASWFSGKLNPEAEEKRLRDSLEVCESHSNRLALAGFLSRNKKCDEAIALFEQALKGHYKQDPEAILGLAGAHQRKGNQTQADEILAQLEKIDPTFKPYEVGLLRAQLAEAHGEVSVAGQIYESLLRTAQGQEARCHYALMLKNAGQLKEAQQHFEILLKSVGRSPRYYQRMQAPWVAIAKRNLADMNSAKKSGVSSSDGSV